MALRDHRGARPRRGGNGRAGFALLACLVLALAAVAATWPAVKGFDTTFLAGGANGNGEAAPGDHLQTGYRLWLVGHQLAGGHAPWLDPYSLQPAPGPRLNTAAWPFGLPLWPLFALFGAVVTWNLFVLVTIVLAGVAALAWLRALGLSRGAALAGGVAFALAPYRLQQSVGHLLGPISLFVPLALWAFEKGLAAAAVQTRASHRRALRWQAVAALALATIPLSGQVNLALAAVPFFALYALCRTRARWPLGGALAACVAAALAGLGVQRAVIAHSLDAGGRSLAEVRLYSADWVDFLARSERHGSESFVLLGWATPVVALLGLAVLLRERRRGLALALAVGALVPLLLALGTNFPAYASLWHALPPLRYPRVPERLLPIACLALAGLLAVAVQKAALWRPRQASAIAAIAVVALVFDLHADIFSRSVADPGNAAYAALRDAPAGRVTDLPVFLPDVHYGSVYQYYTAQAPRQRTGGYSTLATAAADSQQRQLEPLNCGDWTDDRAGLLDRLDVTAVTLHRGLFLRNVAVPDRSWFAWQGLVDHGWVPLTLAAASPDTVEVVTAFTQVNGRSGARPTNPLGEPSRDAAHYCQGWYGPSAAGDVPMSRKRAPFWVYGSGSLALRLAADATLTVRVSVDGVDALTKTFAGQASVGVALAGQRWHLVTLDVDRLVQSGTRRIGARLLGLELAGRHI